MKRIELVNKIGEMERELNNMREQLRNFNNYETVLILAENIKYTDYFEIKEKMKDIIDEIEEIEELGIKQLAYEIKKNKCGVYMIFHWVGDNSTVIEIDRFARQEDNILKFITIKRKEEESEEE